MTGRESPGTRDDPPNSRRRRLLRDAGAALTVALGAGCLSNPWEPGGSTPTPTAGADEATTATDGTAAPTTTETGGDGTATADVGGGGSDDATPPTTSTPTETPTRTATPTPVPPAGKEPDQVVEVAPGNSFRFSPESFEIATGDTVHWVWRDGGHNVRVESKPDGSDWTGTPGGDSDTFAEGYLHAHTFEVAGEYEYYCAPHQTLGLRGSFSIL